MPPRTKPDTKAHEKNRKAYTPAELLDLPLYEQIRIRPGMYIGGLDRAGLHHLVWEIVGNVVDLHLSELVTTLEVEVSDGRVTVRDDGPGIPASILAAAFTSWHDRATYDGHFPHVHLTKDLHGVGVAVVNALSSKLEIATTFEGARQRRSFARGIEKSARKLGASKVEGTTIRFTPDYELFKNRALDLPAIRERLQEIAWLNPLLRVFFQGERLSGRGGTTSWARSIAGERARAAPLLAARRLADQVSVNLTLLWTDERRQPEIRSYVNMHQTSSGTHVDGLWTGFVEYAKSIGTKRVTIETVRERLSSGLIAIVSVGLYSPLYAGPTKHHLSSPEAGAVVARTIAEQTPAIAKRNRVLGDFLADKLGR